jgi:DNA-binding PadR family transcriptional regulator
MPPVRSTNPLGLAVLALLYERPMHPYEMAQTLRRRRKHESIRLNYGSLYAVVDGLQQRGLVAAGDATREGRRPERTVYSLTDAGRTELSRWLGELLSIPAKEYLQFEAGLAFLPVLPPARVLELLNERLRKLDMEIVRVRTEIAGAMSRGVDRLFLIESEYGVALREAERDWVAALIDTIKAAPQDFGQQWREWQATRSTEEP